MSKKEVTIPHNFVPRDYQLKIWNALDSGIKRAVWACHRRAGKDYTIWNWCIKEAVLRKQIIFYCLPTYSQAKRVIWSGMTKDGVSFIDNIPKELIARKSESELSVSLINGSIIQLIGAESYDRIVGTAPSVVVFSESALMPKQAWDFIRPILTENDGTAIFASTPRGFNWFHDLFVQAKSNNKWFCEQLSVEDTKAIPLSEIEEERKAGMSDDLIAQEFYVSFNRGVEGSYYAKLMDKARLERRIGNLPHDPTAQVHSAWDLGISDSMSIILFQQVGQEIHIINSYENNGEALSYYVNWIRGEALKHNYNLGNHFFPHDVQNRELASGISRHNTLIGLGITPIVLPTLKMGLMDGIDTARGLFPRIWIDEVRNVKLIKSLDNYSRAYDAKNNVYTDRPLHNEWSHFADAFRGLCIACKMNYSLSKGLSSEELYARNARNRRNI